MNQQTLLVGLGGLVIGGLIVGITAVSAVNSQNQNMMKMMGMHMENMDSSGMTMDDMVDDLKGKTGDDFDKAFISGMIEHHEGAIEMAEEAQKSAKHQEIKDMAGDIISAQSKEIDQMQQWQMDWGYETESSMPGMSH